MRIGQSFQLSTKHSRGSLKCAQKFTRAHILPSRAWRYFALSGNHTFTDNFGLALSLAFELRAFAEP